MKKLFLFLLCSVLSAGTASWATSPQPQTVHYELKLKSSSFGDMGTRKMWVRGDLLRWEANSANLPLRLIKNKQGVFLIHPWNKMAAKYPAGSNRGNASALFPGPTGPLNAYLKSVKAARTGKQTVERQVCSVYSYTEPTTKRQCQLWVNARSGSPVKLFLKGVHGRIDPLTATYTKYQVGVQVSDSLFQLPKGYKVRPMPVPDRTAGASPTRRGDKRST